MKKDRNEDLKEADNSSKPSKPMKFITAKNPKKDSVTKVKQPNRFISILALIIALATGGYLAYQRFVELPSQTQKENEQLNAQIETLQKNLQAQQIKSQQAFDSYSSILTQKVETALIQLKTNQNQTQSILETEQRIENERQEKLNVMSQQIAHLTESLQTVTQSDNSWMLAQANYLANLASRKIWNEQDYQTAYLLLKNADATLAQMNDQQMIPARKAIAEDLNQISSYSFVDYDGIILSLMRLSDAVDKLPLIAGYQYFNVNFHDDSFVDSQITESPKNWQENISATVEHFLDRFIKVTKLDEPYEFDSCLLDAGNDQTKIEACQIYKAALPPEQATYLRENIRLKLLIAAQAVPRRQNVVYQTALENVNEWINAYFATDSSALIDFMYELHKLQTIDLSDPQSQQPLKSIAILDALMKQKNKD